MSRPEFVVPNAEYDTLSDKIVAWARTQSALTTLVRSDGNEYPGFYVDQVPQLTTSRETSIDKIYPAFVLDESLEDTMADLSGETGLHSTILVVEARAYKRSYARYMATEWRKLFNVLAHTSLSGDTIQRVEWDDAVRRYDRGPKGTRGVEVEAYIYRVFHTPRHE